jgi:hypothetical protein
MRWMRTISITATTTATMALIMVAQSPWALGQVTGTVTFGDSSSGQNELTQPFLLSSVPSEVVESIANYRRYCQRSQW